MIESSGESVVLNVGKYGVMPTDSVSNTSSNNGGTINQGLFERFKSKLKGSEKNGTGEQDEFIETITNIAVMSFHAIKLCCLLVISGTSPKLRLGRCGLCNFYIWNLCKNSRLTALAVYGYKLATLL